MAAEAFADTFLPASRRFRPSKAGLAARGYVALLIAAAVLAAPLMVGDTGDRRISVMAIYAIIGLSVNIITGYAGQISLGHQAFVGIGAFTSAYVATRVGGAGFLVALPAAALMGAILALLLGLVALRIRGLYLALVTLAFGRMAEGTIFAWREFTGGGAGALAPRPSAFASDQRYAYLCILAVGFFLLVDWRLAKSKAGRAIISLRNDERVAKTLGVNVTGYKLLAFGVGGFLAGAAGSLFAHWNGLATPNDFTIYVALTWILMAVVGGLGSRAGVVIGSAFFALFPYLLPSTPVNLPIVGERSLAIVSPLLGSFLLLMTLTLYPGGIGQQLLPLRRWLAGGPLVEHARHRRRPGEILAQPDEVEATTDATAGSDEPTVEIAVPPSVLLETKERQER